MPQSAGRGLATWPIRRKLVALVAVPILAIVATGIWLTVTSVQGLRQAERTRALAIAALATNRATVALDDELTATLVRLESSTLATKKVVSDTRSKTDQAISDLNEVLKEPPGGDWPGDVLMAGHSMELSASQLPSARRGADAGTRQPLVIETSFQSIFRSLRYLTSELSGEIATNTTDGDTVDQASMLAALAAASAAAADERATGTIAMTERRLSPPRLAALQQLAIEQNVQLGIAHDHATPKQQSDIEAIIRDDDRIEKFRADLVLLSAGQKYPDSTAFSGATGQRLHNLDDIVGQIAISVRDVKATGVRDAMIRTIVVAGLTVFTLLLVFGTLASIARTVTGPMRKLRSGAVEVATVRLPQAVRQIEQQGIDATIDLPPVMLPGTVAGPETLEVAHAVDGLTAEAVRLATAQVRLRHALDEAFVSMSRRSQTMVEKQLTIIDDLESTEEDPEQLRNLFRLDHLAARMRRYNDNLLVLAGSSVRTRSNTPVPVSDVFRAATSEMEQYERVRLQPVNSATIAGPVAGGLIHLLAELLDNAAMYSPPTSPILLTAAFTPGGGLHLEVTDSGVGIPPAELAELNARLATPGTIDTQIPSRMGLFVVGRLAQRGGFEVRLSARASASGTVAEVLVPPTHVMSTPQAGKESPQPGLFPPPAQRTPSPVPPQGMPSPGMPSPGMPGIGGPQPGMPEPGKPSGPPFTGSPPPPGVPAADLPPSSVPAPNLPRRPNLMWPGADRNGTETTPDPSTGSLPSRVPGAALSGGPLSGGGPGPNGTAADSSSPFNAFGDGSQARSQQSPPGTAATGPSSATAAWSAQARAARAGSSPNLPQSPTPDQSGGPNGDQHNGDRAAAYGAFRQPRPTHDPSPGSQAPARGSSAPEPAIPPFPSLSSSSRNEKDPDPFATAKLFGVEVPDPASAAGLFTAGPKSGAPSDPQARTDTPDVARREGRRESRREGRREGRKDSDRSGIEPARPNAPDPPEWFPTSDQVGGPGSAQAAARDSGRPQALGNQPLFGPGPTADPNAPVIGNLDYVSPESSAPIYESVSAWFTDHETALTSPESSTPAPAGENRDASKLSARQREDRTEALPAVTILPEAGGTQPEDQPLPGPAPASRPARPEDQPPPTPTPASRPAPQDASRLIDLPGDTPASAAESSRWASLGDQRWLAANARAASAPQTAGDTSAGLPRRQPGANLLPSAAAAAPNTTAPSAPPQRADADTVRGRLGSYQRGISSARQTTAHQNDSNTPASLFIAARTAETDQGRKPDEQGGEQ